MFQTLQWPPLGCSMGRVKKPLFYNVSVCPRSADEGSWRLMGCVLSVWTDVPI